MKTLSDLFELVAQAVAQNTQTYPKHWFIHVSGHVNTMRIDYYPTGWSVDAIGDHADEKMTEDGIQALYWFLKTRI